MSKPTIELKGSTFTLPVICINDTDSQSIITALTSRIQQAPNLLKNASVVVNISALPNDSDLAAIRLAILSVGMNIVGISGYNEEKKERALAVGLSVLSEGLAPSAIKNKKESLPTIDEQGSTSTLTPLFVDSPVRSGQQVYAKGRDMIVTAAVSHGAEIIADGHLHIYSKINGKVIAGASGNKNANIFCTQLEAELVSIAGNYWLSDNIPKEYYGKSVRIRLDENHLYVSGLHIE